MGGPCNMCGEDVWEGDENYIEGKGGIALLCDHCRDFVEENERVTGRFHVKQCPQCGKVENAYFEKYKPKTGRKVILNNGPIQKAERKGLIPIDHFLIGEEKEVSMRVDDGLQENISVE